MTLDRSLSNEYLTLSKPKYIFVKNIKKNTNNYNILIRQKVRYVFDIYFCGNYIHCLNMLSHKLLNYYNDIMYEKVNTNKMMIKNYYKEIRYFNHFSHKTKNSLQLSINIYKIKIILLKKYGSLEINKRKLELDYIKSLKVVSNVRELFNRNK